MPNLPTRNNNPGDLKNPSTGIFRQFASADEGFKALKDDLLLKMNGQSKTGVTPNSDLNHFASIYAPASDRNNPEQYAQNLSKKLGVPVNTPISQLKNRVDDFASAIADNEGFQGNRVLSSSENIAPVPQISGGSFTPLTPEQYQKARTAGFSSDQILQNEKLRKEKSGGQSQPDANGFVNKATIVPSSTSPNQQETTAKPGLIQSVVQGLTNPLLRMTAGASTIGGSLLAGGARAVGQKDFADKLDKSISDADTNGIDYGYLGKVKPVGAGFDINKSVGQNVAPLADAAGTGAQLGAQIASGESLLKGASGLVGAARGAHTALNAAAPIVEEVTGAPASQFSSLGTIDKYNALNEALKAPGLDAAHKFLIERAMDEVAPHLPSALGVGSFSELHPLIAKAGGLTASALKTLVKFGLAGAGFAGVNNLSSGLIPK